MKFPFWVDLMILVLSVLVAREISGFVSGGRRVECYAFRDYAVRPGPHFVAISNHMMVLCGVKQAANWTLRRRHDLPSVMSNSRGPKEFVNCFRDWNGTLRHTNRRSHFP